MTSTIDRSSKKKKKSFLTSPGLLVLMLMLLILRPRLRARRFHEPDRHARDRLFLAADGAHSGLQRGRRRRRRNRRNLGGVFGGERRELGAAEADSARGGVEEDGGSGAEVGRGRGVEPGELKVEGHKGGRKEVFFLWSCVSPSLFIFFIFRFLPAAIERHPSPRLLPRCCCARSPATSEAFFVSLRRPLSEVSLKTKKKSSRKQPDSKKICRLDLRHRRRRMPRRRARSTSTSRSN